MSFNFEKSFSNFKNKLQKVHMIFTTASLSDGVPCTFPPLLPIPPHSLSLSRHSALRQTTPIQHSCAHYVLDCSCCDSVCLSIPFLRKARNGRMEFDIHKLDIKIFYKFFSFWNKFFEIDKGYRNIFSVEQNLWKNFWKIEKK